MAASSMSLGSADTAVASTCSSEVSHFKSSCSLGTFAGMQKQKSGLQAAPLLHWLGRSEDNNAWAPPTLLHYAD